MITIETTPYSVSQWYAGTYTDELGDYEFTIESRSDENNSQTLLTWRNDEPGGDEVETEYIREQIINQYQNSKI